ncbi:MAG: hypothetical protein AB8B55_10335 [Mariniblastus sp.]
MIRALQAGKTSGEKIGLLKFDDDLFLKTIDNASVKQLVNFSGELNDFDEKLSPREAVLAARRRVQITEKMLAKRVSPDQRKLCIGTQIDSLFEIYILNFQYDLKEPSVVESLKTIAKTHLEDADPEIARRAKIAALHLEGVELARRDYFGGVKPIAKKMVKYICELPDDKQLFEAIESIVDVFNENDKRLADELVKELVEQKEKIEPVSVPGKDLVEKLVDHQILVESGYQQSFENRRVNGKAGQAKLVKLSRDLVSRPEAGPHLISVVDDRIQWFEKNSQFDLAKSVYEKMLESADSLNNVDAALVARKLAGDGLKRIESLEKPIELSGAYYDGSDLKADDCLGKIVVVLFWSTRDEESIAALKLLQSEAVGWAKSPVKVLAVCVDRQLDDDAKRKMDMLIAEFRGIGFLDGLRQNPIFKQCPSVKTPRVLLVDKKGIVRTTNLSAAETRTEVRQLP